MLFIEQSEAHIDGGPLTGGGWGMHEFSTMLATLLNETGSGKKITIGGKIFRTMADLHQLVEVILVRKRCRRRARKSEVRPTTLDVIDLIAKTRGTVPKLCVQLLRVEQSVGAWYHSASVVRGDCQASGKQRSAVQTHRLSYGPNSRGQRWA